MTELVRRLEHDGLVERRPDPVDARATLVFLTERSRAVEPAAAAALAELDRLARERLGSERADALGSDLRALLGLGASGGAR
jgi:DNA-binding MarR family transcriptional regulator